MEGTNDEKQSGPSPKVDDSSEPRIDANSRKSPDATGGSNSSSTSSAKGKRKRNKEADGKFKKRRSERNLKQDLRGTDSSIEVDTEREIEVEEAGSNSSTEGSQRNQRPNRSPRNTNRRGRGGRQRGTLQARWDEMYQRLVEYKNTHGNCLVPNRYDQDPSLGAWVSTQRRQYKILTSGSSESTPMTSERAHKLNSIGFVWATKDPRHTPWETRFEQLKEFLYEHGHCLVPIGYRANVQLANWVSTQRQEYKCLREGRASRLSPEKIEMLESVGFVWDAQRGGNRRSGRYKPMKEYIPAMRRKSDGSDGRAEDPSSSSGSISQQRHHQLHEQSADRGLSDLNSTTAQRTSSPDINNGGTLLPPGGGHTGRRLSGLVPARYLNGKADTNETILRPLVSTAATSPQTFYEQGLTAGGTRNLPLSPASALRVALGACTVSGDARGGLLTYTDSLPLAHLTSNTLRFNETRSGLARIAGAANRSLHLKGVRHLPLPGWHHGAVVYNQVAPIYGTHTLSSLPLLGTAALPGASLLRTPFWPPLDKRQVHLGVTQRLL